MDLQAAARQVMLENGFEPDFPPPALQQLAQIKSAPPQVAAGADVRDLRSLLWSSIDNDTSRDLDQIEVAEKQPDGKVKVMIGIADVDAFVARGTPLDLHAAKETTTVYTGVRNFAMLPEDLSTGATSLLEGGDKLGVVTEFLADSDGHLSGHIVYRALLRNKAQLTYNAVGAWLEERGPAPPKVASSPELQAQLRLQDEIAQALKNERHRHGALNIDTAEVHPVLLNQEAVSLEKQEKNRATELIEDFMIAANGAVALMLEEKKVSPSGGWSRCRNDGTASWRWRHNKAASCRRSRTPNRSMSFCRRAKRPTPTIFLISRSRSSSLWGRANMFWNGRASLHPAILDWPWKTTRTPRRRIAALLT